MKKKDKIVLGIGLFAMVLTLIIGTSFAYWKLSKVQEDQNVIATGCFNVEFTEGDGINLQSAYPISDEEGLKLTPYTFTITNKCDSYVSYQINLETLSQASGVKVLPDEYVRADLREGTSSKANNTLNSSIETETTLTEATKAYKLYTRYLKPNQSKTYNLRIWMDKDTPTVEDAMNAFYSGKVTIDFSYMANNPMENAGTLRATIGSSDTTAFYNYRKNITKVVFQNELKPIETDLTWDVSNTQDGSVMSYLVPNEEDNTKYTLYLQGDGGIYANPDSSYLFYNFKNLNSIEGLEYFDTSYVTVMSQMFYGCQNLVSLDINNFDTSNATSMFGMFYRCESLTELDVSGFDTSNATNMGNMFQYCTKLLKLDLSNFDTSNVTVMGGMFANCHVLNSLNLSSFNTSKVHNMHGMFAGCLALEDLSLSNFDTSEVTVMTNMFQACRSLTSLDLSNFDTSKVTVMDNMFNQCDNLISINMSSFDTSRVINMAGMFSGCSSLTNLDLNNFDTSKVTTMNTMFSSCRSLTSLELDNFDFSQVTDTVAMFYDTQKLSTILNIKSNSVRNYIRMFEHSASKPNQIVINYSEESSDLVDQMIATKEVDGGTSNVIKGNLIPSYNININTANVISDVTKGYEGRKIVLKPSNSIIADYPIISFKLNGNLVEGNTFIMPNETAIISDVKLPSVIGNPRTDAFYTYKNDITKVVFQNELKPIDTELSWDISADNSRKVMSYLVPNKTDGTKYTLYLQGDVKIYANSNSALLFNNFINLTAIEGLEYLDTSKVINMNSMFINCEKLTSLNLSAFDFNNVRLMGSMFSGCRNLTDLIFNDTTFINVDNVSSIFANCQKLTTTITIGSSHISDYRSCFILAATDPNAKIILNYKQNLDGLVEAMLATKSSNSNVVKGTLIS